MVELNVDVDWEELSSVGKDLFSSVCKPIFEMVLGKKHLLALCLIVATIVCVNVMIARHSSPMFPPIEKIGKVKGIKYYIWHNHDTLTQMGQFEYGVTEYFLNRPSTTLMRFEDGEAITFLGVIEDVEIGGKYRIVYHVKYVPVSGNLHWSGNYYEIESIEEME